MIVFLIITSDVIIKCFLGQFCVEVTQEHANLLLLYAGFEFVAEAFGVIVFGWRKKG